MDTSDKPQGYYDEIEITSSKKDDLLQFLSEYEVNTYSNADEGYDYLEDNALMLVVKNPYCDETLDIELSGEFSLFFAGWHTHYFTYEYDYEEMKKDIRGLLKGDIGALIVNTSKGWLCSNLCKEEVNHLTDEIQLLKTSIRHEETIDEFLKLGGCIKVVRWNPADTISFDVSGGNMTPTRKFPRRSTERFVVQDDKAIGSGSYKKFDDETAFLTYLRIEPSDEYDEKMLYEELYQVLENDIIADGYKTIFTVCDKEESGFYEGNGYSIGKERNQDKLTVLMGVEVIHDVMMEKHLI